MKRSWLALIVVLIWQAVPAQAAPVTIGGRIVDADGKPVRGASVELVPVAGDFGWKELQLQGRIYPEAVARAESRSDGRFTVAAPDSGMWQVLVGARGFIPQAFFLLPLLEDTEIPLLEMTRNAPLRVRVLDPQGRPVAGAAVVAGNEASGSSVFWSLASQLVRTGADGIAELSRPKRGLLEIEVLAPGRPRASLKVEPSQATAELRLTAGCERSLQATVQEKGSEPRPVAGALVTADGWTLGATDAAGRLTIAAPCDRDLRAEVATRDGRQAEVTFRRGPAGGPPVAVRLPAQPASVSGRVVAEGSRAPVAGALVWPSADPSVFVRTDAKGTYTVRAPADSQISAAATGYLPANDTVRATAGPTLSLTPASTVSGMVVDEAGRPVADVVVRTVPEAGAGRMLRPGQIRSANLLARTGPQGLFRVGVLPGQPFLLTAAHPDFTTAKVSLAELAPQASRKNVRIVLQRGRSGFGKVVDLEGRPLAGAEVSLIPSPDEEKSFRPMIVDWEGPEPPAVTDAQGRFSLEHLVPGRFDLSATSHGFAPTLVRGIQIPAQGQEAVNLGTIALGPGVALTGVVVEPQGRPVAGATIDATPAGRFMPLGRRRGGPEDEILTAADGSFSVPDLRAGDKLRLSVHKRGYASVSFEQVEAPGAEPLRIVLTPGVRLAGRILDESGEPVSGARVNLAKTGTGFIGGGGMGGVPGRLVGTTTSEDDGAYVFEGVEAGKVRLTVVARGFREKETPGLDLAAGRDVEDFDVTLERGAALAGRVVGPDGAPVVGARVQKVDNAGRAGFSRFLGGATTDGDGNYRLEGLDEGSQSFAAQGEDLQRAVRDLDVHAGENRLDFRLEGGYDVSGRVVDTAGQPVAGAQVQVRSLNMTMLSRTAQDARSAADGSFRVSGLAPGVYNLQAGKEGYAPARREALQVSSPVQGLELRLEAGGSVHGRLVGLEFADLADVNVSAVSRQRAQPSYAGGKVDYQGQYRIGGLGEGEWSVTARTADGRQAEGKVTIAAGSDATLDLEFGQGLTLTGRIVRGGEPVPNVRVFVHSQGTAGSTGTGTSDPQGAFRIEGLKPGAYELQAMGWDSGVSHQETLEISADRDILIELSTRRVSGRVIDAFDQSPVADAVVFLEPAEDKPGPGTGMGRGNSSDGDGAFTLTDVAPGTYRLRARKDGYAPAEAPVQVGSEADVNEVRVMLQPTQGLALQVQSSLGAPPVEVQVAVVDAAGQVKAFGSYPTGENGKVRFTTAPAGSWRLLTSAAGSATVTQDVQVPGPPVRVVLFPGTRLTVSVPGLAEGSGTVTVTGADGRPFRSLVWSAVRQEWPVSDGQTVIDGLLPGSWQIRASAPDGKSWQGTVTTSAAGGTASVVLR